MAIRLTAPQRRAILGTPNVQDARIDGRPNTLASLERLGLGWWGYQRGNGTVRKSLVINAEGHRIRKELLAAEQAERQARKAAAEPATAPTELAEWELDLLATPVAPSPVEIGQRVESTVHGDTGTVLSYITAANPDYNMACVAFDNTGEREVYTDTLRPAPATV